MMVETQNITAIVAKGIRNHQYDENMNIPLDLFEKYKKYNDPENIQEINPALTNPLLNKRFFKIHEQEVHEIDTSLETLQLLDIIVYNVRLILKQGISVYGILLLGAYLRNKGNKVDFIKLRTWLSHLHLEHIAQLEGSILISVFKFKQDEIPFVKKVEPAAYRMTLQSVNHAIMNTTNDWHFKQGKSGFVRNNSVVLRRNLRRSVRYLKYSTIETISNLIHGFVHSLSEIEE